MIWRERFTPCMWWEGDQIVEHLMWKVDTAEIRAAGWHTGTFLGHFKVNPPSCIYIFILQLLGKSLEKAKQTHISAKNFAWEKGGLDCFKWKSAVVCLKWEHWPHETQENDLRIWSGAISVDIFSYYPRYVVELTTGLKRPLKNWHIQPHVFANEICFTGWLAT